MGHFVMHCATETELMAKHFGRKPYGRKAYGRTLHLTLLLICVHFKSSWGIEIQCEPCPPPPLSRPPLPSPPAHPGLRSSQPRSSPWLCWQRPCPSPARRLRGRPAWPERSPSKTWRPAKIQRLNPLHTHTKHVAIIYLLISRILSIIK